MSAHAPAFRNRNISSARTTTLALALVGTFALTALTGCGIGAPASTPDILAPAIVGRTFGGPNPVIGAKVKIYTTGNSDGTNGGYGVATMRQEASSQTVPSGYPAGDTDQYGNFSFAGGYSCPAGQFAYIVAAGGNTGATTNFSTSTATATLATTAPSPISTIIAVTAQGAGYIAAGTTVTITPATGDTTGSGATATATVSGGRVTSITVTNAGTNYTAVPTVTISAPNNVGGANLNSVLVAALGRCEDLYTAGAYTGGYVYINELTTVAAAYALGNFSAVSGSGASTVVSIGATATNNAAQISAVSTGCVAGVGSCTTTAAAGLAHAFLNAANLVNVFASPAVAYASIPGNSAAIVPQQLINTIGNILIACVNSSGGASGDGSACGNIFGATGGSNTFSAMVGLAANPTLGGSVTAVDSLYVVANTFTNVYSPFLTSTTNLNDYSIAIDYTSGYGFTYPESSALDVNDVIYIGSPASGGNAAPTKVISLSSNGNLLSSASNSTLKNAFGLSVDGLGNGYFCNGSGSSSNELGIFTMTAGVLSSTISTGTTTGNGITIKPYFTAVDRHNNVWAMGTATSGTSTLFKSAAGGAAFSGAAAPSTTIPSSNFTGLAIDPNQNVWITASTALSVWPNTGTSAIPAYAVSLVTATTSISPATGITFAGSPYVAYIDGYTTTPGIEAYTPTITASTPTITNLSGGGTSNPNEGGNPAIGGAYTNEADGNGIIWLADTNSHSIVEYTPGATPTASRLIPCGNIASGVCGTGGVFGANKPYSLSIDSTGSIWSGDPASNVVIQIIGSAAPTWPLLSLGLTGKP